MEFGVGKMHNRRVAPAKEKKRCINYVLYPREDSGRTVDRVRGKKG